MCVAETDPRRDSGSALVLQISFAGRTQVDFQTMTSTHSVQSLTTLSKPRVSSRGPIIKLLNYQNAHITCIESDGIVCYAAFFINSWSVAQDEVTRRGLQLFPFFTFR